MLIDRRRRNACVAQLAERRRVMTSEAEGSIPSTRVSRACRKCGEYIPSRVVIDGRERILNRRKFCLRCSPFGAHNTKVDDPSRPSLREKDYKNIPVEVRQQYARRTAEKRRERKQKLVEMSGGKCIMCGYARCLAALSFHHRNPEEKKFGLTVSGLGANTWKAIIAEWKKCDLLCRNCHAEIEYKPILEVVTERLHRQRHVRPKVFRRCVVCRKKTVNRKYCSPLCCHMAQRRVKRPTKRQLKQLIQNMSWCAIGRKYGVSDNAIRQWARGYDLL